MNINDLYNKAINGDQISEKELFNTLDARFRYLVSQIVWVNDDINDIIQDTLTAIALEYKKITIEISFSAWAYKVLDNRILSYKVKTKRQNERVQLFNEEFSDGFIDLDPLLVNQLLKCLKKIHKINGNHARVLNLKHQGFETIDICNKLKISRNNLYIMLYRARKWLTHCLETGEIKSE